MLSQDIIDKLSLTDKPIYNRYMSITDNFRNNLPDNVSPTYKLENELISAGWTKFFDKSRTKFYHPGLSISTTEDATLYYKFALLDNLNKSLTGKSFSNLIYTSDKWSLVRGMNQLILEPVSAFSVFFEFKKSTNTYTLRHNGSQHGCDIRKSVNIDINMEYLLMLQFGPNNKEPYLKCSMSGKTLSGISATNFLTNEITTQYIHQVHHALYTRDNGSIYKTKEPSSLLGSTLSVNFSHEVHLELLGCIILCGDSHDTIHNSNPQQDGIDNWFKRANIGECANLPFHWQSEENYKTTLDYLDEHTMHFDKTKAPTYDEFILMHSTSCIPIILAEKLSKEQTTKNSPSLFFDFRA